MAMKLAANAYNYFGLDMPGNAGYSSTAGCWVSLWFKVDTLPSADTPIVTLYKGGGADYFQIYMNAAGRIWLQVARAGVTDGGPTGGSTLATGTWYHIALLSASNNLSQVFVNGVADITVVPTTTTSFPLQLLLLGWIANGLVSNYTYLKFWNINPNQAQNILNEMKTIRPQYQLAYLKGFVPFTDRTYPYISHRSEMTTNAASGGTITDVDNPPLGWGNRVIVPAGISKTATFTGGVTPGAGTLSGVFLRVGTLLASITPVGTLAQQLFQTLTGVLSSSGLVVIQRFSKILGESNIVKAVTHATARIMQVARREVKRISILPRVER